MQSLQQKLAFPQLSSMEFNCTPVGAGAGDFVDLQEAGVSELQSNVIRDAAFGLP